MKTQQTTISEVRLVYRTKIKASESLQIKRSNGNPLESDPGFTVLLSYQQLKKQFNLQIDC